MALAEPRRRTKLTLNPRGNLWANDETKVGLKLMEKMGYQKGKGLGKNKNGIIAPITLRQKQDSKGMGFEGHDDVWLAHQDDFQAVLASLNVEHGNEAAQEEGRKSLEKLSKKSKKRVHYQKFTRGKDLANYSSTDLGCILGTGSEKMQALQKEKKEAELAAARAAAAAKGEVIEEKEHGVVTIQKGNYQEYFQQKMAALKAKGLPTYTDRFNSTGDNITSEENSDDDEKVDFVGFSGTENVDYTLGLLRKQRENENKPSEVKESSESSPTTDNNNDNEELPTKKKKKKSKKEKGDVDEETEKENIEKSAKKSENETTTCDDEHVQTETEKSEKKKKKKKDKDREVVAEIEAESEVAPQVESTEVKKKKKKKDKQNNEECEDVQHAKKRSHTEDEIAETDEPLKKRKKKNKKEKSSNENEEQNS